MQVTLEAADLAAVTGWASRSLAKGSPGLPILAGVRLTASETEGVLYADATDVDTHARAGIPAGVRAGNGGTVLLPGRLLGDIARALPPKAAELRADGHIARLDCGNSHYEMPVIPGESYPDFPSMPVVAGAVPASLLASALAATGTAASKDIQPIDGVRVEAAPGELTFVGTDKYRLVVVSISGWEPAGDMDSWQVTVPYRTLAAFTRLPAADRDVSAWIQLSNKNPVTEGGVLGLRLGAQELSTRLGGLEYPNWQNLLAKADPDVVIPVATDLLAQAVNRVALVLDRSPIVDLACGRGCIEVRAAGGDGKQATEMIDCGYDGETVTISANPDYLLDGLAIMGSQPTEIRYTASRNGTRPFLLVPAATESKETAESDGTATYGYDCKYLLMPVRRSAA